MEIKFDFQLNARHFGIVEKTVIKLVINGIESASAISELLWLFSEKVKASAMQNLVNAQILHADLSTNSLSLTDGIKALVGECNSKTYMLDLPESMLSQVVDNVLVIEDYHVIVSIIDHILPEANLTHLAKSLCFSISLVGKTYENT